MKLHQVRSVIENLRLEVSALIIDKQRRDMGKEMWCHFTGKGQWSGEEVTGVGRGEQWQAEAVCHRAAEDKRKL